MSVDVEDVDVESIILGRLEINKEEKEKLRRFSKNETGREAIRALIILWYDEGMTESKIANLLSISVRSVRRWIRRYKKENIEGLRDRKRTGRPRKTNEQVEKVVEHDFRLFQFIY